MDKNTLSNYGWIIITVVILSMFLAFAFNFGDYIKNETENQIDNIVNMAMEEDVETSDTVVVDGDAYIINE